MYKDRDNANQRPEIKNNKRFDNNNIRDAIAHYRQVAYYDRDVVEDAANTQRPLFVVNNDTVEPLLRNPGTFRQALKQDESVAIELAKQIQVLSPDLQRKTLMFMSFADDISIERFCRNICLTDKLIIQLDSVSPKVWDIICNTPKQVMHLAMQFDLYSDQVKDVIVSKLQYTYPLDLAETFFDSLPLSESVVSYVINNTSLFETLMKYDSRIDELGRNFASYSERVKKELVELIMSLYRYDSNFYNHFSAALTESNGLDDFSRVFKLCEQDDKDLVNMYYNDIKRRSYRGPDDSFYSD